MRNAFIRILKVAIPLAVIAWLVATIEPVRFAELRARNKDWLQLAAGLLLAFGAVCLSFMRWYLLVRTLSLRFTLRDAFRLSFLGYLGNFVAAGNVGGDLFKAIFIAREQPHRRSEAVATVIVDRVIGLYALLLVATSVLLFGGLTLSTPALRGIARTTILATSLGGIGVLLLLIPGFTNGLFSRRLTALPRIGPTCDRLITSVRMYRDKPRVMAGIFALSMLVHAMLAVAMFFLARGLYGVAPTLAEHFIIVPLSLIAGAMPFTPAGLGTLELAMEELYRLVPVQDSGVSGVLLALAYRLVTIAIAAIGVVYSWCGERAAVKQVEAVTSAVSVE